ncbi:MAG: rhodanese-like domain-containing protein [bacterium]|nr:rhodanese-like domain-containing protein [bacterium]
MKWNDIITPIEHFSAKEMADFMRQSPLGSYELLDVRQPAEYAEGHLPGARLIPLDQLLQGQFDFDPRHTLLIYCRAGNRSLAAAQYLNQMNSGRVVNLVGGIMAWEDKMATGPYEHNLQLFDPETEFEDALSLAYAMEEGLRRFYISLGERITDPKSQKLLEQLAEFEENHKASLDASSNLPQGPKTHPLHGKILETGSLVDELLGRVECFINGPLDVFDFAMGIEAQAFDFYMRLSYRAEEEESSHLFRDLAEEELTHLDLLVQESKAFHRSMNSGLN